MKSLQKALSESIARLEASGGDIDAALARHSEHAEKLRPYLLVWLQLHASGTEPPSVEGFTRGIHRLSAAIMAEQGGRPIMNEVTRQAGFALKLAGATALVAAIALGITFLTGNLRLELGSSAEAGHTAACLDQVLGNLDGSGDAHFTVDDLLAFRDAARNQDTDPRFDRNGDGTVDIDDVMIYIQELRACFTGGGPPIP